MTDDLKQIGVRVDRDLWQQFRRHVKAKHGRTKGTVGKELEQALQAYMGGSDLQSIDDRLRRIEDSLDVSPPQGQQTSGERETPSTKSNQDPSDPSDPLQQDLSPTTQSRVDDILDQLPDVFDRGQLDAAIANCAGSSYKTQRKYREILTQRKLVVQAPWESDQYYQSKRKYAIAAEHNLTDEQLYDVSDNLAPYWGENWLLDTLPEEICHDLELPDQDSGIDRSETGFM